MTVRIGGTYGFLFAVLLVAAGSSGFASIAHAQDFPPPRQTCTATNVGGSAYDGFVCGGSVIDDCSPGAIYQCQGGGVQDPVNNCVLFQSCASGCLTGPNSTAPTVNTDFPVANDACFAGARPLTVSPVDPVGGTDVTVTATLSEPQNTANGPILNMNGGGVLIPHPFCAVPFRLGPGPSNSPSSVTFGLPTAVVNAETAVHLHAGISYIDTNGRGRFLVSVPFAVRLQPGGTEPDAPAVKAVTVGPSVIGPGNMAVGDVELVKFAPARGIRATLTSSHPEVAAIIENNQPSVPGACTMSTGVANIQAASFIANDTTVTISATSGAPGETPATTTLIVRATPLRVAKVAMSPNEVLAGSSSTGTVTLSRPAPAGGAQVLLVSSEPVVTVPASVTVAANQTSATFTASTRSDAPSFVSATIRASIEPNNVDASAQLRVWPAGTVQGVAALSLNPSSVVGPASSAGTVTLKYAPPSNSVTVTLSSSNTTVARVPSTVTVSPGAIAASFTVSTSEVAGSTAATISAGFDGSVQTAIVTVKPANPPPPSAVLTAFAVNPTRVTAGQSATGTVTLQSAQSVDVPVDLGSQIPTSASVPASVIVPAGATSANFAIATHPGSGTVSVTLSATLNGTTLFSVITVEPAPAGASLSSLSLNPVTVVGGTSSTGTVTLTAPAASGGTVVSLSDNSSTAVTPSSVTVPAGATSASFTVTTSSVSSNQTATVTASLGSATRSASLTITPPGGGGGGTLPGFLNASGNAPDSGGDGNGFQSSATNAYADDTAVATDTNSGTSTSTSCTNAGKDRHRFYDFGISVPAGSAVAGIEVRLDARADSTSGTPRMCVQLSWDGGTTWTAAKTTGTLGTSLATFTLGGAADTWGRSWSPADFGNANFRVRVINVASSTSRDFFLEWIGLRPHFTMSGPAALNGASVNPTSVTGGMSATGTVTLTAGAPSGGAVVSLTSSNGAVASTPSSVTIAAGATSATFPVTTTAVTSNTSVTLTAAYGGASRSATLTVTPPPPPASLSSLAVNPTSVTGGSNSQGTVTLSSAAPSGGMTVTLSSSDPVAAVPANVTVAQGATSATFTIATGTVSSSTPATITASDGAVSRTATLTINPPATTATLTVTATGRSGERVISNPTGINVSVGSTASASFPAGTSITLSVSNGRDAVWSGACSSGGQKTRTCTFTLTANASVTANVQ
jgi:hypothetical protein